MWHMPGHIFSKLKRYNDAAWQQEASARIDHAFMMRDRVMPDEIHNFAHNNEWLARNWINMGRAHEALGHPLAAFEAARQALRHMPGDRTAKAILDWDFDPALAMGVAAVAGAVTATATIVSPVAIVGNHCSFWASVPPRSRARVRISGRVMSEPPAPSDARDSSSVAMTMPK